MFIIVPHGSAVTSQSHYYHPDHLGSSSQITDGDGNLVQHLAYLPFGEIFLDRSSISDTWNTPYKFSGKELDPATGLYYLGARYYNPKTSVWLGVDPLAEKYPSTSPYMYCLGNPVVYFDPDGRIVKPAPGSSQTFIDNYNTASKTLISNGAGGSFNQLVNSNDVYYIQEGAKSYYDAANMTISWNTTTALEVDGKVVLSPTGVLGHEIEHAKNHDDARAAWWSGNQNAFYGWEAGTKKGTSINYKSKEEENVITGAEQRIAKALGSIGENETTRNAYIGKTVRVDGINSLEKPKAMEPLQRIEPTFQIETPNVELELK